ncbi:MAG TPA: glucose-6-phosphate dehydrogenase assembly protein OpcA, partial [Bryobacteraceae bacterium]
MPGAFTADRLLAELEEFWTSLAGAQPAGDEKCVLRACAMTLIVLERDTQPADASAQILAEVMREHPNRAVIVRIHGGSEPRLEHRVTAQCRMPYAGRQQVCCEQIEITASEPSLAGLAPILLAIAAPDLPVVVWCRDASLLGMAALDAVFRAGKVLVDSCPA